MLDVHPPHHTPSTWRDFFLHIVTIVIGLLIAIGLEQGVEYLHHRHQLEEARGQLSAEIDEQRLIWKSNSEAVQKIQAQLNRNMILLLQHRSSNAALPEKLDYSWTFKRCPDAAWQAVRQNGTLDLLPYDELKADAFVYTLCSNVMDAATLFNTQIEIAAAIANRSPDGKLSPRDTDDLIAATSDTQGKLAFTAKLLTFQSHGFSRMHN